MGDNVQLQNLSLTFIHTTKSFRPTASLLSHSTLASNTTACLDKLTCTDCVYFGKFQDRFGPFPESKIDSTYLVVKLNVFKKDDIKEFQLVQNLTREESEFRQFMRLRIDEVTAAENFTREKNLSSVVIPTLSKNTDEPLKLTHKVVDVVDRANRKIDSAAVHCGQATEF